MKQRKYSLSPLETPTKGFVGRVKKRDYTINKQPGRPVVFPTSSPLSLGYYSSDVSEPRSASTATELFTPVSQDLTPSYSMLFGKLESILSFLESEVEVINVRDECALKPNSVQVQNTTSSSLLKRRLKKQF